MSASSGTRAGGLQASSVPAAVAAIADPGAPYRAIAVAQSGGVRGAVTFDGDVPRDTVMRPTADLAACGTELTEQTIALQNGRLAGAVVWLAGVRAGKPLPLERRYELMNDHCRFLPRVQAAAVGGTVNVRSADQLVIHVNRFVRQAGNFPVVAVTHTNNDGQVVPVEALLRAPGLVEARCDSHPWSRGWLFVFDHPYFATTATDGSFSIDSVPPGRYTMNVWHERAGIVSRDVTIGASTMAVADVSVKARR